MTLAVSDLALCAGCGYDLAGLDAPGVCPECARPFAELPGDERVTLAWPCLRCGYSLAGLQRSGRCSECGMPAHLSLSPALLRFQPIEYRGRLRSGALLACLGLVGTVFLPIALGLLLAALGRPAALAMLVLVLGAIALFAFGWLRLLAIPPATFRVTRSERAARTVALVTLIAAACVWALSTALTTMGLLAPWAGPGVAPGYSGVLSAVSMLAWATFWVSGLLWLRALLKRARSARRRPGAAVHVALWSGVGAFVLYVGAVVAFILLAGVALGGSGPGPSGVLTFILGAMMLFGFLCAVVAFFSYLVALDSVRVAMARVQRDINFAHHTPNATPPSPFPNNPES